LLFILSVLLGSQKVMAEPIEQLKLTPADLLVQNNTGGIIRVNDIKLQETQNGLELILITDSGQRLVPLILPEGNNLVIDLLDARLDLATGDNFRVDNPAPGIRAIIATQVDERNIRLTIEGENNTPSAEIVPNRQNLVLSIFSYEF
jgi:iron complex outermembrane receptor protein